jgi:hypothetical protein
MFRAPAPCPGCGTGSRHHDPYGRRFHVSTEFETRRGSRSNDARKNLLDQTATGQVCAASASGNARQSRNRSSSAGQRVIGNHHGAERLPRHGDDW